MDKPAKCQAHGLVLCGCGRCLVNRGNEHRSAYGMSRIKIRS